MRAHRAILAVMTGWVFVLGCASSSPVPNAPPPVTTRASPAPAPEDTPAAPACDVVCEGAKVTVLGANGVALTDAESLTQSETAAANRVLGAMHEELLACYKARLRVAPGAHGAITFDIVIGPEGRVLRVESTGGEGLGSVKECIGRSIQKATFTPPHGGGTRRIHVPFTLRLQGAGEST